MSEKFQIFNETLTVLMCVPLSIYFLYYFHLKTRIKIDRTRFQQTSSWKPLELVEKKIIFALNQMNT